MGPDRPNLRSGRPHLGFERPDLGSEGPDLGSRRPGLRFWEGGDGRTETGEICPKKTTIITFNNSCRTKTFLKELDFH